MPNQSVTVLVDSREQRPLLFPDTLVLWSVSGAGRKPKPKVLQVKTESIKLDAGDYAIRSYVLAGWETLAGVERKLNLDELADNTLTDDRPRFLRAFRRLAQSYDTPYLFIEEWPDPWWTDPDMNTGVAQAVDSILQLTIEYKVRLIWGGRPLRSVIARRRAGELILRILLAHTDLRP
jgi:ERCC4-type nuclease